MRRGLRPVAVAMLASLVSTCSRPSAEPAAGSTPASSVVKPLRGDPRACGDKVVMARFDACKAAAAKGEQAVCVAAGGHWGRIGLHVGCACPTGQAQCPCGGPSDCLGICALDPPSRGCPKHPADATWRCSTNQTVAGCHCLLTAGGKPLALCTD